MGKMLLWQWIDIKALLQKKTNVFVSKSMAGS
jgi:hypothetical protein